MKLDRCPSCLVGRLERKEVDKTFSVKGRLRVVRRVPMRVCARCGERFLDDATAAYVDRVLGIGNKKGTAA